MISSLFSADAVCLSGNGAGCVHDSALKSADLDAFRGELGRGPDCGRSFRVSKSIGQ
jgi:hypothetical protein